MKIEEYIKLRKKHDSFDETNWKNKEENIHKLIDYIFDYYKLLEEDQSSKKSQTKELRRNVNYQYEIELYSEDTQRWLINIFTKCNVKMNRQITKILDSTDFFLLISDTKDWERLSYDLYTKMAGKYKILSDYPFELLAFAKDYYKICDKNCGLSISRYKLSQKSKKWIKDFYSDYGINLVAWAKFYLEYFYSSVVLWPPSHRIMIEEDAKKKYQYNLNVTRNVFNIGSVLDKISEENGASEQLKKNKKILVELMKEINDIHHIDEKEF